MTPTAASSQAPMQTPSETPVASALSLELVAQHSAPESCWSVVIGNVYDLTDWIARHPGGSGNIIRMCGIDATADFDRQHGGQGRPESELTTYLLGALGQPPSDYNYVGVGLNEATSPYTECTSPVAPTRRQQSPRCRRQVEARPKYLLELAPVFFSESSA